MIELAAFVNNRNFLIHIMLTFFGIIPGNFLFSVGFHESGYRYIWL